MRLPSPALSIIGSLLITASAPAAPLNWVFTGTTAADSDFQTPSSYNGTTIPAGTPFTLTILVNTTVMGSQLPGLADVIFDGPFQAQVQIGSLGPLPLFPFTDVQYLVINGGVAGVQFDQVGARTFTNFPSTIPIDILHLTPIGPVNLTGGNQFINPLFGPNDLAFGVSGYNTFAAISPSVATPEAGSTVYFFALGLLFLLGFNRYRLQQR